MNPKDKEGVMAKSSTKRKGQHEGWSSLQPQQADDCGRETETTKTGTTVVADVKGGSGHRGDDGDDHKKGRHRSKPSRKGNGGRGTETTETGTTVVANVKGGTGHHEDGPYPPK
jgi:hypothetical protein